MTHDSWLMTHDSWVMHICDAGLMTHDPRLITHDSFKYVTHDPWLIWHSHSQSGGDASQHQVSLRDMTDMHQIATDMHDTSAVYSTLFSRSLSVLGDLDERPATHTGARLVIFLEKKFSKVSSIVLCHRNVQARGLLRISFVTLMSALPHTGGRLVKFLKSRFYCLFLQ